MTQLIFLFLNVPRFLILLPPPEASIDAIGIFHPGFLVHQFWLSSSKLTPFGFIIIIPVELLPN